MSESKQSVLSVINSRQRDERERWAADIITRLGYFDPAFIAADEGVTPEAIWRRLLRAGAPAAANRFYPLVADQWRESKRRRCVR